MLVGYVCRFRGNTKGALRYHFNILFVKKKRAYSLMHIYDKSCKLFQL